MKQKRINSSVDKYFEKQVRAFEKKKAAEKLEKKDHDKYRYYLHKKVKEFTTMNAKQRSIDMTEKLFKELTDEQRQYIFKLATLGYNIQMLIA